MGGNCPGDLGSIPGRVIPKTQKMVLDTSLISIIRYVSRVKWSNPGKGVAPSPTPRCSSYWKGSFLVPLDWRSLTLLYLLRILDILKLKIIKKSKNKKTRPKHTKKKWQKRFCIYLFLIVTSLKNLNCINILKFVLKFLLVYFFCGFSLINILLTGVQIRRKYYFVTNPKQLGCIFLLQKYFPHFSFKCKRVWILKYFNKLHSLPGL